jgi:hypothetical protein
MERVGLATFISGAGFYAVLPFRRHGGTDIFRSFTAMKNLYIYKELQCIAPPCRSSSGKD